MRTHFVGRGKARLTTVITLLAAVSGLILLATADVAASTVAAALAAVAAALLGLLLRFERRRRRRAEATERWLQSELATAVIQAVRLRSSAPPRSVEASGPGDEVHAPPPSRARPRRAHASAARSSAVKRVIGYVTVSEPRANETTPADAIQAACQRSGWTLADIVRDRENGRILERPGLRYALEQIAKEKANALVVGEMRRLSRSIVDLGALLGWFRESGATLIALDTKLDTSTREGYHVATTLIALGNWERERIASRTRSALAEVRANGQPTGRPAVSDRPELLERISAMRAANLTLRAIADQLNAEQIPTLRGGREWRPSSIQAALGYRRPGPRDHLPSTQRSERA
jgi:DNA invertase Pin-like site-specific DNA recombinase